MSIPTHRPPSLLSRYLLSREDLFLWGVSITVGAVSAAGLFGGWLWRELASHECCGCGE